MLSKPTYIPNTIKNCSDAELKEFGISAYTKGTEHEKKVAFEKCFEYEQMKLKNQTKPDKQNIFNSYLMYVRAGENKLRFNE